MGKKNVERTTSQRYDCMNKINYTVEGGCFEYCKCYLSAIAM